jgi:hypothetical protein
MKGSFNVRPSVNPGTPPVLPQASTKAYEKPQIHLALLLDVSGSMSGLINQARAELWKVVNALTDVTKNGVDPEIRVSLYSYGMSHSEDGLYINQEMPLTMDLDGVSEALFALQTTGSSEYCGTVIQAAAQGLEWSTRNDDLKAVIIAGNEPFTQGPIPPEAAVEKAQGRSINIHTVYCGDAQEGVNGGWKMGATLGKGRFMSINHNATALHIDAPQDDEIIRLGVELNKTYIPYGKEGQIGASKQLAQDSNARSMSKSSVVQRAMTKSGKYYRNTHWDLVDGVQDGAIKVKDLKADELPKEMRGMSTAARVSYIESKQIERAKLKNQIQELRRARDSFVAQERKKQGKTPDTLDSAMIEALREQAVRLGFTWPVA